MAKEKADKKNPEKLSEWREELPLIPLRNMVIFPQMIVPLFIGRTKSLKALESTLKKEKMVVFASQKKEETEEPGADDLCRIGTLAEIVQMLSLPDGTIKILVEGIVRARVDKFTQEAPYFRVSIAKIAEEEETLTPEKENLMRNLIKQFESYVKLNKKIPSEILMSIINVEDPGRLTDLIASYLTLKLEDKQSILEALQVEKRMQKLSEILDREIEILSVEVKLQSKVRKQIEKVQKEYYLKEKLKAIHDELGEEDEDAPPEIEEYKKKIYAAKLPNNVKEKAVKELDRLRKMPSMTAEASVIRTYLDWLVEMPWNKKDKSRIDINEVKKSLDEDHYGLKKVKERILEYFAVVQLTGKIGGSILCFVGPPGVGKTSVASSIAKAMGRKFVRVALGGVRDEAEIRGHRRTYVGSLPGRVIQSIHKTKVNNPVFLLDEIDKVGKDFRGDPSAALLEVLDPEQNKDFTDHYLEVAFDLSDVFFITTANTIDSIPRPLRDRMELIQMSGYTEEEKIGIAEGFIFPKQMEKHGLAKDSLELQPGVLLKIIREYAKESGVRELERSLAAIMRKVAVQKVSGENAKKIIEQKNLQEYLGAPKYRFSLAEEKDQIGIAMGMAWTEVGGDILPIEVNKMPGRGNLTITGQLGEVMQESAKAAMSYVRSRAHELGIDDNFYRRFDVHIHVPDGAVPKDGPSAGITIVSALVSCLTEIPIKKDVAMTGEITLRGKVLPIGGLKEKLLAAHRAGIRTVIIPEENRKDYEEIKNEMPEDMLVNYVKEMNEVIPLVLCSSIKPFDKKPSDDDFRRPPPPTMYA